MNNVPTLSERQSDTPRKSREISHLKKDMYTKPSHSEKVIDKHRQKLCVSPRK